MVSKAQIDNLIPGGRSRCQKLTGLTPQDMTILKAFGPVGSLHRQNDVFRLMHASRRAMRVHLKRMADAGVIVRLSAADIRRVYSGPIVVDYGYDNRQVWWQVAMDYWTVLAKLPEGPVQDRIAERW